jgi:hypothetical protein
MNSSGPVLIVAASKLMESTMILDEYIRLAKSVDYVSIEQSKMTIGIMLDKLKGNVNAVIVDLWTRMPGQSGVDILQPYLRRSDPSTPTPMSIALTREATGLLTWVAETEKSVWLKDIDHHASSGINVLTGETIEGRHFSIYERTREYAAIPIKYRSVFAILAIEMLAPRMLHSYHIDLMETFKEPTGILIWKASVTDLNSQQTSEAIDDFRYASSTSLPNLSPYRRGFVARPFEVSFNSVGEAIEKAFKEHGVQATSYQITPGSSYVVAEMLRQINSSHFGIVDITHLNKNVLIELGAIFASTKPLLILRNKQDEASSLPFNIAGAECYTYEMADGNIDVSYPGWRGTLQDLVQKFISDRLLTSTVFQKAKRWPGK